MYVNYYYFNPPSCIYIKYCWLNTMCSSAATRFTCNRSNFLNVAAVFSGEILIIILDNHNLAYWNILSILNLLRPTFRPKLRSLSRILKSIKQSIFGFNMGLCIYVRSNWVKNGLKLGQYWPNGKYGLILGQCASTIDYQRFASL